MVAEDKLQEFTRIEGFSAVGVFNPQGESLAVVTSGKSKLKEIGALANNVLMNAQKATRDMGLGRGSMIHIEAENAHVLVRCLNEGSDALKSERGKAHIHLVLVLNSDAGIGLAKMLVGVIIHSVAEDFRM